MRMHWRVAHDEWRMLSDWSYGLGVRLIPLYYAEDPVAVASL